MTTVIVYTGRKGSARLWRGNGPRVIVDGAGELSFPIPDAQIRALIAAAERAPYGKGTETLVDTAVRDCWQIDATRVRLAGRAWPDSFAKVMELVAAGLGLPAERLNAELYKLLIYRPGGFFAEHRDTGKVPGMVATLSLSLPTPGAGGELIVRHGRREKVHDLSAGEPSELSFAAFYADCLHEVRPLVEGHRVTLVFNLFLGTTGDAPGAPDYSDLATPVAECLARWRDEEVTERRGRPYTLVCTKNRASHERRLEEYAEDLRHMGKLLLSMPEGEGWEVGSRRAEQLEEALARGGE